MKNKTSYSSNISNDADSIFMNANEKRPKKRIYIEKESNNADFDAKIRYLASSLIVTIPRKIATELELKLGETVTIKLQKNNTQKVI